MKLVSLQQALLPQAFTVPIWRGIITYSVLKIDFTCVKLGVLECCGPHFGKCCHKLSETMTFKSMLLRLAQNMPLSVLLILELNSLAQLCLGDPPHMPAVNLAVK